MADVDSPVPETSGTAPAPAASAGPPPRGGLGARHLRLARLVLLAGFVASAVAGLVFWRYSAVRETTDDAQVEGHIVPIAARVGGTVKAVLVEDNQEVAAGTVLVEIDPADYEVARRRAEAELADAQANALAARTAVPITQATSRGQLAAARATLEAVQKELVATRARVDEAAAGHRRAAADLARFEQLIRKDEISRQQYDAGVAAEAAARATLEATHAAVAAAESRVIQARAQAEAAATAPEQIDVSKARAGAAEASGQKAAAALEQATLNLSYTTIRAPVAGIVSRKTVQVGQVIQPGQQLVAIVPLKELWVVANFKETQLRNMKPGQPVAIDVDAYRTTLTGRVESIGGATSAKFSLLPPENATGNFVKVVQRVPVKIVFDAGQDQGHRLRPGMSVVPTVRTDQ